MNTLIKNQYLFAINRFQEMLTLGISKRPLKLGDAESKRVWGADFDIHVEGLWRVRQGNTILLSWDDVYTEIDRDGEIVEKPNKEGNEFIRRCTLFEVNYYENIFPELPLKILNVHISEVGDLRIELENGYCIETFTTAQEDEQEEWRLIDLANGRHYVWPEVESEKILLLDETGADLTQILKCILQEIVDDDILISSEGIHPGEKFSERVLEMGREWYDIDFAELADIDPIDKEEFYDYVVPIGIKLQEHEFETSERILNYQEYSSTGCETQDELYDMAKKICMEIGCNFAVDVSHREMRKQRWKNFETEVRGIETFFKKGVNFRN